MSKNCLEMQFFLNDNFDTYRIDPAKSKEGGTPLGNYEK